MSSQENGFERKDVKAMKSKKDKKMELIKGFTLVELLVVISIIALLLAIMMPALSKARESAQSTVCKSNIKQIVLAATTWAQEHEGYVVASMWYVPAKPYEKDTSSEADLARQAISRGASLEPYTGTNQAKKSNLYCCPTAAKFGDKLFALSTSYFYQQGMNGKKGDRIASASYGVNALAVSIDWDQQQWLGVPGTMGTREDSQYATWGHNNVYMLEHGKSKLLDIPQPSRKVYFTDFAFPSVGAYDGKPGSGTGMHMYDPLNVCFRSGDGGSFGAYAPAATIADARGEIVQSRWHGAVNPKTGYGYGNIGWFDGSASKEPPGYDSNKKVYRNAIGNWRYNWHQYWQNPKQ
jgi:prepilin-type N-terminal cleavage/methylation domain-containing protein